MPQAEGRVWANAQRWGQAGDRRAPGVGWEIGAHGR